MSIVRSPARPRAGHVFFSLLPALGLASLCSSAHAQSWSVGVGGGIDRGHVDCVASFPCDRSGSAFKASVGYRFAEPWDVQLAYLSAGRFQGGDPIPAGGEFGGTFKVDGVGLTAGYRWDFAPQWSATARLGAASMHTRFQYANALAADVSKSTVQPLAGLGVGYAVTPNVRVGIDYDVTRFKVYTRNGSLRMLGAAVQFSF